MLVGALMLAWGNGESCWLAVGSMTGFFSGRVHEVPETEEKEAGLNADLCV